ncbi:hypothetical protein BMS3Abin02_01288 [bacterium BMS3Abin02]|nr:hypothetical protein BMS3Abin02_01288 [bacterium BMS3Abin02]
MRKQPLLITDPILHRLTQGAIARVATDTVQLLKPECGARWVTRVSLLTDGCVAPD